MTLLADESLRRHLLRSIDAGRRFSHAAAAQQRRAAILSRRRAYLHLPAVSGARPLAARAALSRLRYPPALWGLVRAAVVVIGGLDLAILPVRGDAWLTWLLIAFFMPPIALVEDYAADSQPFLRQFVPLSPVRLALIDALLPGLLVLFAGTAQVLLLPLAATAKAAALLLLVALLALSTLVQALREAGPDVRAGRLPAPDVLTAALGYGLLVWLGMAQHQVLAAAVALLAVGALCAALLQPA